MRMEKQLFYNNLIKKIAGCELKILKTVKPNVKNTIYVTPIQLSRNVPSVSSFLKCFEKHLTQGFIKKRQQLISDGFIISVQNENILIVSRGKKGSLYCVFHLLEKYFGLK